ncbi:MAG: bile acid:sodium symporter family protein [Caulobacter sp.]|nr:bile acid:sodium symporter family protein [Caulobacter sp.]
MIAARSPSITKPRPWSTLKPDPYIIAILLMVVLASLLPVRGEAAVWFGWLIKAAIALLFFLHGARLPREHVIAGLVHWRLHLLVLGATFGLFPLLGLAITRLPEAILPGPLAAGVLYLCLLPSTVQSSIAFTAQARGNVAAAVVAASTSNLIGVILTPLMVGVLLHTQSGGLSLKAVQDVAVQILLPFILGQAARPLVGGWVARHARLVSYTDRGSILLVVYGAFSAAVVGGLWKQVSGRELAVLLVICLVLLAVMLTATLMAARALKFSTEDEIVALFCGSKKGLATGVPMASILFPAASVGFIVLPVMLFHQIQLMACAVIAQRYGRRP